MEFKEYAGWEKETANRFVGFFDIMGFKDYVYRNDHNNVKMRMNTLHRIIDTIKNNDPEAVPHVKGVIRVVIFSDSILFLTKDNTKESLSYLFLVCTWFLAKCIEEKIPIKGALSYGMLTTDFAKSIFFGKALIDAYALQEELHFYGCALDNKIERKMKKFSLESSPWVKSIVVPLKTGGISHYIINWRYPIREILDKDLLNQINKYYLDVSGSVRKYIDNTVAVAKLLGDKK